MSSLLHQLRRSGLIDPASLDAATRRQQIYGGSLDTVLLELGLIEAAALDAELSVALGMPSAPAHLLEPQEHRPWSAVPSAVTDLGWAMALARTGDTTVVAVHPEIPDEQLDQVRAAPTALELVVTAECVLARIASERTGALTPQRYAVLAARYVQALGGQAEAATAPSGAPWRSADPGLAGNQTLAPRAITPRARRGSGPILNPPTGGATSSWGPQPAPVTPGPSAPPPSSNPEPVAVPKASAEKAVPNFVPPTSSALFGEVLERQAPTPAEEIDLGPVIAALDAADDRDAITSALFDGFERLFERAALFAIRKSQLKLLSKSEGFRRDAPGEITMSPEIERFAKAGPGELMQTLEDPAMRQGLGQAGPISCAAAAVHVAGRPVLLAYGDLVGQVVDDAHAARAAKLCTRAGAAFTRIIAAKKQQSTAAAPSASSTPTHVPDASSPPPIAAPRSSTPPPVLEAPQLPRLIDKPPARSNTLISTTAAKSPAPPELSLTSSASQSGAPKPVPQILTPNTASRPPAQPPVRSPSSPALLGQPANTPSSTPESGDVPPVRRGPSVPPFRNLPPAPSASNPHMKVPPIRVEPPAGQATGQADGRNTLVPTTANPGAPPIRRAVTQGPQDRPATAPDPQDSTIRPKMGAVPPVRTGPTPGLAEPPRGRVAPSRSPTMTAPAVQPRVAPADLQAPPQMVPLGPPLTQNSSRGALVFDDEDRVDDSQERMSTQVQDRARIDAAIDDAIRNPEAIPRLLELGEPALARVAARFPGPLDLLRRDLNALPPLPAHGPLIRLTLALGTRMVPRIRELLDHPDAQVRFYAAFAFQELRDDGVIESLATRAFDPDGDVRTIAMRVLETYSRTSGFSARVGPVRAELRSPNQTRQVQAARAVGTLRDVGAVPDLINLLDDPEKRVREIGLEALCSITGQQLGSRANRWRNWWGANADRSRIEWVIDALSHKEPAVRRWASGELRRITGQPFAFNADGNKSEREAVIKQWKQWYASRGADEFG